MTTMPFEIRIALFGGAGNGKTTLINALVRDNYGSAVLTKRKVTDVIQYRVNVVGKIERESYVIPDLTLASEETVKLSDGQEMMEVLFDIQVEQAFVETRDDTRFVFVCVPDGEPRFHTYAAEKWDTFDAAFIIIDGKKGFKEEDEALVKSIKENLDKRSIPVLTICNKIDDIDDEKLQKHAKRAKQKVEKILETKVDSSFPKFLPISAIQGYAYRAGAQMSVYHYEDFDKDMIELVGKEHLGSKQWKKMDHEERFRKTHAIIKDEKLFDEAMGASGFYQLLRVLEHTLGGEVQQHMLFSQIDLMLKKLSPYQSEWISRTLFTAYRKHSWLLSDPLTPQDAARKETFEAKLRHDFWKTFEVYQDVTFQKFVSSFPRKVEVVVDPLRELMYYHKLVGVAKWEGEEETILERMKTFVRHYIYFLLKLENKTSGNKKFSVEHNVSPLDWSIIWRSMLLLSYDRVFCETFGKEKIILEELQHESLQWKWNSSSRVPFFNENCPKCRNPLEKMKKKPHFPMCKHCSTVFLDGPPEENLKCCYCGNESVGEHKKCHNCKYLHEKPPELVKMLECNYDDEGVLVPSDIENYKMIVHLDIPVSLEDSSHYGNPIYTYCNFVAGIKKKDESVSETEPKTKE